MLSQEEPPGYSERDYAARSHPSACAKVAHLSAFNTQIGVDERILSEKADEEVIEVMNGCICCTVRGDLVVALKKLYSKVSLFDAIIIETTGLADQQRQSAAAFAVPQTCCPGRLGRTASGRGCSTHSGGAPEPLRRQWQLVVRKPPISSPPLSTQADPAPVAQTFFVDEEIQALPLPLPLSLTTNPNLPRGRRGRYTGYYTYHGYYTWQVTQATILAMAVLTVDAESQALYTLDGIITVVDAKHILARLDDDKPEGVENEAVEQAALLHTAAGYMRTVAGYTHTYGYSLSRARPSSRWRAHPMFSGRPRVGSRWRNVLRHTCATCACACV